MPVNRKARLALCLLAPAFLTARAALAQVAVPRVPVVSRYRVFERSFAQSGSYANPYIEVDATATVLGPDGVSRTVPLFWDGGATWTMRFSPDGAGRWTWRVGSADAGLDGRAGAFVVLDRARGGGIRRRSGSPQHFERQDGTPFWWMGDTQWRGFGTDPAEGLDHSSVLHYLDVRAAQGFNYVHAGLMSPGMNEGGSVFESVPDETLNPAYFREVDARVRAMNERGITAGIVLAWGSGDPSWTSFTSDAARRRYARYVAARYSAFDVVFVVSGEWDEAGLPRAVFDAIGAEIRAGDPHGRLIGIHGTGSVEEFADDAWMSFGDYQQLYNALHANVLGARDHAKPVVNAEYAYYLRDQDGDGVVDKPNSATLAQIRHATWDLVMAGGYFVTGWGTTYLGGERDPGPFHPDDPRNDDWEEDVQHVKTLFTGLEWWRLEPHDALLDGSGTRYCLARIGTQYLAYARGGGPLTLSLGGAPAGVYAVRLFDPRTGVSSERPAYTGAGPVALSPPDGQDWVFVLTRTGDAPVQPVLRFLDRTVASGFDLPVDIGGWHGTYVCDYDGDGDEDLFMTSHGVGQAPDTGRNALFRNDGTGRFTEVATTAGVDGGLHGRFTRELHGASWLDYDHDGDYDLFMPNTDSDALDTRWRAGDELYRNDGSGAFTDVSAASGLPQLDYSRRGAAAGDFDRDGRLDLFVVDMIRIEGPSETHVVPSPYRAVYLQRAGGTFCLEGGSGCPPRSGVDHVGWSEGVTTLDYDGDSDVDVLVADERGGPDPGHGLLLWENDGTGLFTDVAGTRGLPSAGVDLNGAVTTGDVDSDGDLDVFTVVVTTDGSTTTFSGQLYRNDDGVFTHARTFADRGSDSEHMFFADLDNDGDLDLVWAGVYLNHGDGTFGPDRAAEFGIGPSGRGGMAFDADGDGDLDLVFNVSDRTHPYLRYYRNDVESAGRFLEGRAGGARGPGGGAGGQGPRL
jgi:hypothetical protein